MGFNGQPRYQSTLAPHYAYYNWPLNLCYFFRVCHQFAIACHNWTIVYNLSIMFSNKPKNNVFFNGKSAILYVGKEGIFARVMWEYRDTYRLPSSNCCKMTDFMKKTLQMTWCTKSIYNSYQNDHQIFYHSMLFIWFNPNCPQHKSVKICTIIEIVTCP